MSLRISLSVLALSLSTQFGCGARTQEGPQDSQSHWLAVCSTDQDCGTLSCICGLCTRDCESDSTCWQATGSMQARCDTVSTEACNGLPDESSLCVPDCAGDECLSQGTAQVESQGSNIESLSGRLITADPFDVPACPEVALPTGAPAFSVFSSPEVYSGVATVSSVTAEEVVLVPNEVTGTAVTLRSRSGTLQNVLSEGLRVELEVLSGGTGSGEYAFAAVYSEGALLFAVQQGSDFLYQSGDFTTPELFGATLELRMQCQHDVDDGCFENQVQGIYSGIFRSDTEVTTDGTEQASLTIAGLQYDLFFTSSSVDGGAPTSEACTKLSTGRYVSFTLLRR